MPGHHVKAMFHSTAMVKDYDLAIGRLGELFGLRVLEYGEAPEVELDMVKQTLEMRGGVKLSRGQGWIQAEKATIELATAKVTATQIKGSIPVPKP